MNDNNIRVDHATLALTVMALDSWLKLGWRTGTVSLEAHTKVAKLRDALTDLHDGKTQAITLED